MTAEVIYLPMPASDLRDALNRHDQRASLDSQHWLLFSYIPDPEGTEGRHQITGCACGFRADTEEDCGWGDSVVDHLLEVGKNRK